MAGKNVATASKTVQAAVADMYARMARAAADRAIECAGQSAWQAGADKLATNATRWMLQAGARAVRWRCLP